MSQTALTHPLVDNYLFLFDAAAAVLPVQRARELREQLVAHIQESVGPDASNEEIAAVLSELGPTRLIVAEAAAATGTRSWAARVGWKIWTLLGVIVLVIAAVAAYYIRIYSAEPLLADGATGWLYAQDGPEVTTQADGATQTTVPIRSGQRQGFYVQVYNPSGMTQRVIGSDLRYGPNVGTNVQVTLSTSDPDETHGSPQSIPYALPVSIPPGQSRLLRITWISHGCLRDAVAGMDSVELRVRIGWTTRTEDINFHQGFYLGQSTGCRN
jgi:hypothetical protein